MDIFERIQSRRAFLEKELAELDVAERTLRRLGPLLICCPNCCGQEIYVYRTRAIFKCKACGKQFSKTSGTPYRHHKMPVEKYERARDLFQDGATATYVTRQLGIGYKTALGMKHRMKGQKNG